MHLNKYKVDKQNLPCGVPKHVGGDLCICCVYIAMHVKLV